MTAAITIYTGPMGAGKSGALVSAIEAERSRGVTPIVFCPSSDTRSGHTVKARGKPPIPAQPIRSFEALHAAVKPGCPAVAIDEAHMLERTLGPGVLAAWALQASATGTRVYIATIDIDANGEACAPIPMLRRLSRLPGWDDSFTWHQLTADCSDCRAIGRGYKGKATYSWMVPDLAFPIPGDLGDEYLALCGEHFWSRMQERWNPEGSHQVVEADAQASTPYTDAAWQSPIHPDSRLPEKVRIEAMA